jgi:excisionase family DNA binding protein
MLTATQAADALGVSKRHLYALAAKGLLPCYRFGSAVRFDAAEQQGA